MPEDRLITLDKVPSTDDPGDETARRFCYQWTYAAVLCCMLLDDTESISEVFCEHHEDVLIKHLDGSFSGLQIKTRESGQEVWKTGDEAVRSACARFSKLEALFPGQFRSFRFLTNHPLYSGGNGQDLRRVLQTIRDATPEGELSGPFAKFISRVATEAGSTPAVAFAALSKTIADDGLPKLSDVEARLVATLTGLWSRAADCPYASVQRAARYLTQECGRASSLAHLDVLPAYLPATADPQEAELAARLSAKRIDQSRLLEILDRGLSYRAQLDGDPRDFAEPGIGTTDLLLKKLDAGGFSAVSRNSALDLRNKADYLGILWVNKHGREPGLQRYGHVRSLVLSDAARAYEATKKEDNYFGLEMLSELRSRFKQRRTEGSELYECSNEHLEGFAYSLTSQCQVQWSYSRPWEDEQ
jgi:hypothetical protein